MKPQQPQRVYFVLDRLSLQVKIGRSVDVQARLASLKTANPHLELIGHLDGEESQFHAQFSQLRMDGEFFKCEGSLLSFLRRTFPRFKFRRNLPKPPAPSNDSDMFDIVVEGDDLIDTGAVTELLSLFGHDNGDECCGDEGICECDDCVISEIENTLDTFAHGIGIMKDERAVFFFVKPYGSGARRRRLRDLNNLADIYGRVDMFSIGREELFGQNDLVIVHRGPLDLWRAADEAWQKQFGEGVVPETLFWPAFKLSQREGPITKVGVGQYVRPGDRCYDEAIRMLFG